MASGQSYPADTGYRNSVNVAATLSGLITSTQRAVQTRSSAFKTGSRQIWSVPDLKCSIDQNTPIQVQTGQTINELNGIVNNAAAAQTRRTSTASRLSPRSPAP